jgi:ABC-type sugar transport system ATPase subunit
MNLTEHKGLLKKSLKLKNISKSYGSEKILDAFDLEVNPGEFLVLVGPSGSGKSTLIRIIAGLEKEDAGEIYHGEKLLNNLEPKNRDLSMVFQNYALYPHKTVFENIAFPLELSGFSRHEKEKRVLEISEKLEIKEYLKRKPRELSGGQRQRVALARAMIKEPSIYLMDEPLSNLDAKLRAHMRSEITNLYNGSEATFIYVTHDQVEALSLGDRIVILNKGSIQQIASPEEIYNDPANTFVASFIGSPPTNLIRYKDKADFILGIRPEFLSLEPFDQDGSELSMSIENIELLGSDFLIYGKLDSEKVFKENEKLIAKIPNEEKSYNLYKTFQRGDLLNLYYPLIKEYLFDAASGLRIKAS